MAAALTYTLLFFSLYFEIFLLVAFLERRFKLRGSKTPQGAPAYFPSVAIIVPCFNEEKTIAATLASLLRLEYPGDKLEIVVVDDGSTDGTLAVAQKFAAKSKDGKPMLRVFHKENGGKFTAMNFGLAQTSAELVGCLDADSVVASDALLRITPVFGNQKVAAATPGIHTKQPGNLLQHMQHVEYRLSVFNRFVQAALGSAFITPGPFSIFRAHVVRDLGGWRYGHSTEDMEMALRIQQAGFLIGNVPSASVHTATPRTMRHLFRQRVRWTYGFLRNAVDYRSMIGSRNFGNLGLFILPSALVSIGAGIYFFVRILLGISEALSHEIIKIEVTGALPHPFPNLFYFNTSMLWFLVWIAVALILFLIGAGSFIGTGKRRLPIGTPLFILCYGFLVPLWLGTAVVRAALNTGVRWR